MKSTRRARSQKPYTVDPRTLAPKCPKYGKYSFLTHRAARENVRRLVLNAGACPETLKEYKCEYCPYWHVGNIDHRDFIEKKMSKVIELIIEQFSEKQCLL